MKIKKTKKQQEKEIKNIVIIILSTIQDSKKIQNQKNFIFCIICHFRFFIIILNQFFSNFTFIHFHSLQWFCLVLYTDWNCCCCYWKMCSNKFHFLSLVLHSIPFLGIWRWSHLHSPSSLSSFIHFIVLFISLLFCCWVFFWFLQIYPTI